VSAKLIFSTVAIALLITSLPCLAEGGGVTAANFLLVGNGGRAVAMGGAARASVNDASALSWNPARLTAIKERSFYLANRFGYVDMNQGYFGVTEPISPGPIPPGVASLSATYFGAGDLVGRDDTGARTGDFSASDIMINTGFATTLKDAFNAGVSAGAIFSKIDDSKKNAFLVSLGLSGGLSDIIELLGESSTMTDNVDVALVIGNIGSNLGGDGLPGLFSLGASWRRRELLVEADITKVSKGSMDMALGAEYLYNRFALRGGYNTFADAGNGLSLGVGVFVREFTIDYSYVPMGDLGSNNYLGVAIRGW